MDSLRSIACLFAAALALAAPGPAGPPAPPQPAQKSASGKPSSDEIKQARAFAQKGLEAEQAADWETAFNAYSQAVRLAPEEREYLVARERARGRMVQQHVDLAERWAVAGRLDLARKELQTALGLNPGDPIARERLAQLDQAGPGVAVLPATALAGEIRLEPQPGVRTIDYRGNTNGLYEEIARLFGVTASFDVELISHPVRLQVADVDFETAMRLAGSATGTFWQPLNRKLFFVAADTPAKRTDYEASIVRTILLPASFSPDEMTETLRLLRDIAGIRRTDLDTRSRTITLRASPDEIRVALDLVRNVEQARGEMILEIDILEVDLTLARQLGITPSTSSQILSITPQEIQQAQQSTTSLVQLLQQLFGTPASLSSLSVAQIAGLVSAGQVNPNSLIPPLVAFGGGRTTFLATVPGAVASFSEALNLVRDGRRVLLRCEDGLPATFFVGDRFPITLALLAPSLTPSTFVPGVSSTNFPRTDFAVGIAPISVLTADLRNIGKQDIVTANETSNTVSVLLGNGDGTFAAKADYPTGVGPIAVVSGKFNADDFTDLAVANQTDDTLSILLNNGDGTFATTPAIPIGAGVVPAALAIGDFNGDGKPDLVVADSAGNQVLVFLGDGAGGFTFSGTFPTGKKPAAIAVGDFNRDGNLDLAVANNTDNSVSILLGRGDGTFRPRTNFPTGTGPVSLATTDFNNDSILDLAVADQTANTVSVLLGKGDGTFGTNTDFPTGQAPTAVITGDFNVDGLADLVIANGTDNTVSVLLGSGSGNFSTGLVLPVGTDPIALATADFNGDNLPDLAVANFGANTVTTILDTTQVAPGQFSQASFYPGAEYVDLGLKIKATPRLHPDSDVTLQLQFEIRSLTGQDVNGIPVLSNRTIDQTVRVKEDVPTVLAGTLDTQEMLAINGSPTLANIPAVGYAAGTRTTNQQRTALLVVITPRRLRLAPHVARDIYVGRGRQTGPPVTPP